MPINGKPTYYEFFGLENFDIDPKRIKKAYRSMALKWHPDRNENKDNAERMMKQVNEVNRVLTNEKDRYDRYLRNKMGSQQNGFDPGEMPDYMKSSTTWGFDPANGMTEEIIKSFYAEFIYENKKRSTRQQRNDFVNNLSDEEFQACKEFIAQKRRKSQNGPNY